MRTIYVVQTDSETPMMAFLDRQSAEYVSRTNHTASCVVYETTLFEHDCATDQMMEDLKND